MMDHEPISSSSETSSSSPSSSALKRRLLAARDRLVALADRAGLARIRAVPGLGWIVAIGALVIFIQGVGLANLISVSDEKQAWETQAYRRDQLQGDITILETQHRDAKAQLDTTKAMLNLEATRLTELKAALTLTQQLRDEAQKEQAAAKNDSQRIREASESLATKTRELATRIDSTESVVRQLETEKDRLATEVAASKKTLDEQRARAPIAVTGLPSCHFTTFGNHWPTMAKRSIAP